MATLTTSEITKIADSILSQEPYKTEFNNKYFRPIAKRMLVDAINAALQKAREQEPPAEA